MKYDEEEIFSRQIFTHGKELQDKINSVKVLVIGAGGVNSL